MGRQAEVGGYAGATMRNWLERVGIERCYEGRENSKRCFLLTFCGFEKAIAM